MAGRCAAMGDDADMIEDPSTAERFSRQIRFAPIGAPGQARIQAATVAVMGVGALGSAIAEQLVRAGVGRVRVVDRDVVELSNLQRQCLYTEADAATATPKAVAAAARLRAINSQVTIEAHVVEITAANVAEYVAGADVVLDGGDTFALRHLVNEACCQAGIPWVYAACVGAYALCLPIVPGLTPCLRCLQDELPDPGDGPTCDTAGIIAPAVQLAAAWAVAEAMKLLVGDHAARRGELWACDLWANHWQRLDVRSARNPACAACGTQPTYPALASRDEEAVVLCGRDAVQVRLGRDLDVAVVAASLGAAVTGSNEYLVRWRDGEREATAFRDGRVLVHGLGDPARARGFVARWLG